MTHENTDSEAAARVKLAQALTEAGDLTDPAWRDAFETVPRHVFVPHYYGPGGELISGDHPDTRKQWFAAVHEDRALVTHRTDGAATSSSSQPSLMAGMLEALSVSEGMTVLEVGTGTGYNAALLSHRLGGGHVVTIDISPDITAPARERLAAAGHYPLVVTGDGSFGWHGRAPYHRAIVTCGLSAVPPDLVRQLADDGFLLAPLGSALARIHRTGEHTAEGRFLPGGAFFMPLRHAADDGAPTRRPGLPTGRRRPSTLPAAAIADNHFRFLASIVEPGLDWQYDLDDNHRPTGARVWNRNGSIAHLHTDGTVTETGPLWAGLESAHRVYQAACRPGPDRYGVTVTEREQRVWLDSHDGPSWTLAR
ncbi:methyltransferase domain-containing protein [Streptomyces corynorhini]|uniref:Protein-L-isoaspartate O-methyltransferase n=1 Tax=Streptomyces corynorhini TaxID=2282652 RepID=A0A370B0H5_9ACTN|nr:methyltransferase domain-containing protein [Streptomyces corynorhini]RDG35417.1 methyltransferase domain-containing protein [Streptomyces corynorhini]